MVSQGGKQVIPIQEITVEFVYSRQNKMNNSHVEDANDKLLVKVLFAGGVRHDPQRFMRKTVNVPHFNRDTVKYASRERDESKPEIKILLPIQFLF